MKHISLMLVFMFLFGAAYERDWRDDRITDLEIENAIMTKRLRWHRYDIDKPTEDGMYITFDIYKATMPSFDDRDLKTYEIRHFQNGKWKHNTTVVKYWLQLPKSPEN